MKQMGFLRRLLPGWHAAERSFRAWYEGWVDRFTFYSDPQTYRFYTDILSLPDGVRGYREIMIPKMEAARQQADVLFDKIKAQSDVVSPALKPL